MISSPHQHRLLWRHHLGNIFGSIHCSKSCFPTLTRRQNQINDVDDEFPIMIRKYIENKNNSKNKILAIMNLDQASIFSSADSGDLPGVFSTALLLKERKNNNSSSNDPYFPNTFTMKPIDWVSVATSSSSSSFQSKFYEFLEMMDDHQQQKSSHRPRVRICPMNIGNTVIQEQNDERNNSQSSSNRNEWTSTQLLQWRIRSLSLATNLALHLRNNIHQSTTTGVGNSTNTVPSWKWLHNLLMTKNNKANASRNNNDGDDQKALLLRELYAELLMADGDIFSSSNNAMMMVLPPLDDLKFAWEIVQNYGFCISVDQSNEKNHSSTSSSSSLFPTLAPIISTHLTVPRDEHQKNYPSSPSSASTPKKASWSGLKVVATTNKKNNNNLDRRDEEQVSCRIISQKELLDLVHENNLTATMNYIGTKCLSSYYSLPKHDSAEKWYLVVESKNEQEIKEGVKETQLVWS